MENGDWFPFKGTREKYENNKQAAIREIYEETCGIVKIDCIDLKCNFTTKRKHYHIGLVFVSFNNIKQFHKIRKKIMESENQSGQYLEKTDIKLFKLDNLYKCKFHEITKIPIDYYKNSLDRLQKDSLCNLSFKIY